MLQYGACCASRFARSTRRPSENPAPSPYSAKRRRRRPTPAPLAAGGRRSAPWCAALECGPRRCSSVLMRPPGWCSRRSSVRTGANLYVKRPQAPALIRCAATIRNLSSIPEIAPLAVERKGWEQVKRRRVNAKPPERSTESAPTQHPVLRHLCRPFRRRARRDLDPTSDRTSLAAAEPCPPSAESQQSHHPTRAPAADAGALLGAEYCSSPTHHSGPGGGADDARLALWRTSPRNP